MNSQTVGRGEGGAVSNNFVGNEAILMNEINSDVVVSPRNSEKVKAVVVGNIG